MKVSFARPASSWMPPPAPYAPIDQVSPDGRAVAERVCDGVGGAMSSAPAWGLTAAGLTTALGLATGNYSAEAAAGALVLFGGVGAAVGAGRGLMTQPGRMSDGRGVARRLLDAAGHGLIKGAGWGLAGAGVFVALGLLADFPPEMTAEAAVDAFGFFGAAGALRGAGQGLSTH